MRRLPRSGRRPPARRRLVVALRFRAGLRFAEAVNRLDIAQDKAGLPELVGDVQGGGARHKTKGAVQGALEAAGDTLQDLVGDRREPERVPRRRHRDEEVE